MKWPRFRRWWPAAVFVCAALGVMIFAFLPFNRIAREQSLRSERLAAQLQAQTALIATLPTQRSDLEELQTRLQRFKSELVATDEVDRMMSQLRERAEAAGLQMWTLNPSVPVLIQMDLGLDSLSRQGLAVLPVAFECRGSFADVARFFALSESRADFYRWTSLPMTVDSPVSGVPATAEIRLFLLPPSGTLESRS